MVKNLFLKYLFVLSIALISVAQAAEFNVTVSNTNIALNKLLIVKFKLVGATAKTDPTFFELREKFNILSTEKSESKQTSDIHTNQQVEWKLILKPKKLGAITLSSININSSAGNLASKPIPIQVTKTVALPEIDKKSGIFIKTEVSKIKPYTYEPFIYTVKLYSKHAAKDITFEPLLIDGISIKPINNISVSQEKYKGATFNVAAFSYIITPLNKKNIIIPPLQIQGVYLVNTYTKLPGFIYHGFAEPKSKASISSKVFVLQSKKTKITVLPPSGNIIPWIPAKALTITEKIETTNYELGSPISRIITINARGIRGNQLPDTAKKLQSNEDYKVYLERPEINDKFEKGKISSLRQDKYTIIPQKTGKITLPAIKIKWWNVNKLKFVISEVPEKTIKIGGPDNAEIIIPAKENEKPLQNESNEVIAPQKNSSLYLILSLVLGSALIYFIYKYTRIKSVKNNIDTDQFDKISTAAECLKFLQNYSHCKFNIPPNSSLGMIFLAFTENVNLAEKESLRLQRMLEDSLYAEKEVNIENLKNEFKVLFKLPKLKKTRKKVNSKLPKLNPL